MKKFLLIAAACMALVACSKGELAEGTFRKGQKVSLSVNASVPATKVISSLNSDGSTVDFTWEDGDQIKITVDGSSSVFTLIGGAGTSSAHFEGKMPESGTRFDIQYPAEEPDLTSQSYTADEAIPHGMMKFTATGCSLGDATFKIEPQNALLRLNLYGTDQKVSKIDVNDGSGTYSLSFSTALQLPATGAASQPIFVVVPAGTYKFSAEVFDENGSSICKLETSGENTFTNGGILNMSEAKEVKPDGNSPLLPGVFSVSATKKVQFTSGNLYWSGSEWKLEDSQTAYPTKWSTSHVGHFYWTKTADASYAQTYSSTSEKTYDHFFADGSDADHKLTVDGQSGLYILTKEEWKYLLSSTGRGDEDSKYKYPVSVSGVAGCLVIAPDGYNGTIASSYTAEAWATAEASGLVCLPAAGYWRNSHLSDVGSYGYYWSATPENDFNKYAILLYFDDSSVLPYNTSLRDYGYSVRLVSTVEVPVTGVTMDNTEKTVTVGASETLTYTLAPAGATAESVAWSTSAESVATVDKNGKVTGVAEGTATITVTVNGTYTATCAVTVQKPKVLLSGEFTISAGTDETQGTYDDVIVKFSSGNLQATYSTSTSSYSWGFAANQWDYIGDAAGNTSIDSPTDGAVVDLFRWVGASSTTLTSDSEKYGISTSNTSSDYGTLTTDALKADWADISTLQQISGSEWKTMTSSEWTYLMSIRSVNGGTGEGNSYQRATINSDGTGVYGMIIYPDNYTAQTSATTYTSSEWATMESAGCVFLPAAGVRGSTVFSVGTHGEYWSSAPGSSATDRACNLFFFSNNVISANTAYRRYGLSVRLVSTVKVP